MTIFDKISKAIDGYILNGLSAEDNDEFREILRGILLSDESISAISSMAEIPPEFIGEAVEMTADELEDELKKIFGDIPQVAVIKTAIAAVLAAALSIAVR